MSVQNDSGSSLFTKGLVTYFMSAVQTDQLKSCSSYKEIVQIENARPHAEECFKKARSLKFGPVIAITLEIDGKCTPDLRLNFGALQLSPPTSLGFCAQRQCTKLRNCTGRTGQCPAAILKCDAIASACVAFVDGVRTNFSILVNNGQ